MKNLIALIGCLLLFLSASSAHSQSQLVIERVDGARWVYALTDRPTLSFDGIKLVVKSASAEEIILRSEVSKYYFEPLNTGIQSAPSDEVRVDYLDNSLLKISGVVGNIKVYDVSGLCVSQTTATGSQFCEVGLSHLPAGVYVVKVNKNRSIKIYKK